MDAPAAQGEIIGDGQAAASSAAAPPQFSELPSHAEPTIVTAAGNHHRQPRRDEPRVEPVEQLGPIEDPHDDVRGAMTPEGEIYSPTSPGGSPGPSLFDDDFMAGIVNDEENDFRDIESVSGRGS